MYITYFGRLVLWEREWTNRELEGVIETRLPLAACTSLISLTFSCAGHRCRDRGHSKRNEKRENFHQAPRDRNGNLFYRFAILGNFPFLFRKYPVCDIFTHNRYRQNRWEKHFSSSNVALFTIWKTKISPNSEITEKLNTFALKQRDWWVIAISDIKLSCASRCEKTSVESMLAERIFIHSILYCHWRNVSLHFHI